MADIQNIIYSKYIQATQALNAHALKLTNNLGTGIKSKERIRKFNLMSAWLDLLGDYIQRPISQLGTAVPSFFMGGFTTESTSTGYNTFSLNIYSMGEEFFIYSPTVNIGDHPSYLGTPTYIEEITSPTYQSIDSQIYSVLLTHLQEVQASSPMWPPGVTVIGHPGTSTIEFKFPLSSEYNGSNFVAIPTSGAMNTSYGEGEPFEGGSDPIVQTIAYDDISQAKFLEKLDIIAIELGIVYDLSEDLSLTIAEIDSVRSAIQTNRGHELTTESGEILDQ